MKSKAAKSKKERCACEGGTLTKFVQPVILHILSKEQVSGYQLIRLMTDYEMFLDDPPDPAGIYRYLKILENRGLIVQQETSDQIGSPYELTNAGRICLSSWQETLENYHRSIESLIAELQA